MKHFYQLLILGILIHGCTKQKTYVFQTNDFEMSVDGKGRITGLVDVSSGLNYLAADTGAFIMSIRMSGNYYQPIKASFIGESKRLNLTYQGGIEAVLKVESKPSHLTFELVEISASPEVELIVWGPVPTTINQIIGETVGVVRGTDYAIGIQALNAKTLGGYPWSENDCMPQIDIFEQDDMTDLSEEGKRHVLYRVEAARPSGFGSTLQAYCRNRIETRIVENWGFDSYEVPPFEDGGVIGSKIALFGSPVDRALQTIGTIEIQEELPHPLIDGTWGKEARSASAAYLIINFGERDIDRALDITEKAGLKYLYHPGPFENWGHFELSGMRFPHGIAGLKRCVEKAASRDIKMGVHTLSNFITTNDPYVRPVPDDRLAKVGASTILDDIDEDQTEITIQSPEFFNQYKNNNLKTTIIDNELIRYGAVTETAPWKLLDCQRGAYGTAASKHAKGEKIALLADHGYKVFLGDVALSGEMARRLADIFNQTGLRQISFDGLEGNRSTGMGNYGEILFVTNWHDHLNEDIISHFIADASRTSHFFWHMYTRMNWGEPWYAGFRESQTEYRLKNQEYFNRNMMPAMLGWFQLRPETSIEDIEWMLARSAAFNAGYAFVVDYRVLDKNGMSDKILALLGDWEDARMGGLFSHEQKVRMQDVNNEFRLFSTNDDQWKLCQVHSFKFSHENKTLQPGQPVYSRFTFSNPAEEQPLQFILSAVKGNVQNVQMEIDNYKAIELPVSLTEGQVFRYEGGDEGIVYTSDWHRVKSVPMDPEQWTLHQGDHSMTFDCEFAGGSDSQVKLEVRLFDQWESLDAEQSTQVQ